MVDHRRTDAYAIQCQGCGATDHRSYEAHRDNGEREAAKMTAKWAAEWFQDAWFARFGEYSPEAWA